MPSNSLIVLPIGGAYLRRDPLFHAPILRTTERGDILTASKKIGDWYEVLIPMYVHQDNVSPYDSNSFNSADFPFVAQQSSWSTDGATCCIEMLCRWKGIAYTATDRKTVGTEMLYSVFIDLGLSPSTSPNMAIPPFIAQVKQAGVSPQRTTRTRGKAQYVVILEINDAEIVFHNPLSARGGYSRVGMKDFMHAFLGYSLWLENNQTLPLLSESLPSGVQAPIPPRLP